jgi:hypothetical protein
MSDNDMHLTCLRWVVCVLKEAASYLVQTALQQKCYRYHNTEYYKMQTQPLQK